MSDELTNQPEITAAASESSQEARRRKNTESKRKQRQREKIAKAASTETLQQAWERHSEQLKQIDPATYARLSERHLELADLKMEIEDFANGHFIGATKIDECWRDTQK